MHSESSCRQAVASPRNEVLTEMSQHLLIRAALDIANTAEIPDHRQSCFQHGIQLPGLNQQDLINAGIETALPLRHPEFHRRNGPDDAAPCDLRRTLPAPNAVATKATQVGTAIA